MGRGEGSMKARRGGGGGGGDGGGERKNLELREHEAVLNVRTAVEVIN